MPANVILHLGAHRTGSTYLQAMLDSKKHELNQHGIDLLTPSRPGRRDEVTFREVFTRYNHRINYRGPIGIPIPFLSAFETARARRKIRQLINNDTKTIIVSDENLLGPVAVAGRNKYYPLAQQYINSFIRIAPGNVARLFIACRSYDEFIVSFFAMQRIFSYGSDDFLPYKETALNDKDGWFGVIVAIQKAFPEIPISVWRHEKFDPVERLAQMTSIPRKMLGRFTESYTANASPSQSAIDAYKALSAKRFVSSAERDQIVRKHASGPAIDKETFFSPSERMQLRRQYEDNLSSIANLRNVELA